MLEQTLINGGERQQQQLFNFAVNEERALPQTQMDTATRELLELRTLVQKRLLRDGYVLKQSGRFSPADLAGMDYVLYSIKLDRYFFIDVTTDILVKWSLPALRRMHLFEIEVEESGEVGLTTKRQFLEKLLSLVEGPVLFTISSCCFPSLDSNLSPRETACELQQFRSRLEQQIRSLKQLDEKLPEHSPELKQNASLVEAYWSDLARQVKFAQEEDFRQTDNGHLARQKVFENWAEKNAVRAVRATINLPREPNFARRLNTHQAQFESWRDQIVLSVQDKRYILAHISTLIERGEECACVAMKCSPDMFEKKRHAKSALGRAQSAEFLVRLIETTSLEALLGAAFEKPCAASAGVRGAKKRSKRVKGKN